MVLMSSLPRISRSLGECITVTIFESVVTRLTSVGSHRRGHAYTQAETQDLDRLVDKCATKAKAFRAFVKRVSQICVSEG